MVFVNTSLETALDRNRTRERSIPDKIVKDNHAVVEKTWVNYRMHSVVQTSLL